jgi:hypothetical protein
MYVKPQIEARSCNHGCSGKEKLLHILRCVFVDLGIQHAMYMTNIILSTTACPAPQHFSTISHKWHELRKKGYLT